MANYPEINSSISTANSSSTPLASNGVFTGTSEEVYTYSSASVYVFSNVASATDGLSIQQSSDGTNWDVLDVFTNPAMTAGQGKTFGVQITGRYFRIVYTNGATLQTTFRLQTIFHVQKQRTSSVRPQDARSNENDYNESISYLSIFNGTTWDRVRGTSGSMNVTLNAATTGGWSVFHLVSAASTNATIIKAGTGQVGGWFIYNSNAAARKVTFHNTASTPTAGASVFFSIVIPPTSGANVEFTNGIPLSTGIAITTTTGLADNDTAAVALNDLVINIFYK